ncbi:MAG: sulfate adenylyltransferase subunit CysN [Gammaproteobacteria bacterium]
MATITEDLLATNIEEYLRQHERKGLLRFITCGSVDDGKSTLIGRLLYDSKLLFEDQLTTIEKDSKKWGTQGDEIDFALLVDGLAAEREQGITIDVAYRFFATEQRKFIVADTPGHEQYTRNMVTGASTADAAVILVDARQGVLTQTRRHSYLVSLLGIRHVALAINKMDLVGYSQDRFEEIRAEYAEFAEKIGIKEFTPIPVSALRGENIVQPSAEMSWYHGPTLVGYLETVELDEVRMQEAPFRLPVQWVNRPDSTFRGFTGMISSGVIRPGDKIRVQPSGRESSVARIVTYDGDLQQAVAGQSVTLTLADEIDISRGAMISGADSPAQVADQFEAKVVWMADEQLIPGRKYLMKIGTQAVTASITEIKYQVNVNTLEHIASKKLELNEIAFCNLSLDRPIAFDPYVENRDTGSFILIDRLNNNTVGAGMLDFALRRSQNIHLQHTDIDKAARAALKDQKPCVLWFTGLSGSGKSTVANIVEKKLHAMGHHTYLLDGDNVRHGLNRDLGFTEEDRVENIRRVAEVAKLMVDAGLIVLTAFISPYRAERRMARQLFADGEFIEVFMDTPLEVAEARDPKGLYKKARRGELKNFTGVDAPYEAPEDPEFMVNTADMTAEEAADRLIEAMNGWGQV